MAAGRRGSRGAAEREQRGAAAAGAASSQRARRRRRRRKRRARSEAASAAGAPLLSSRLLPPSTLAERKAVPLASPSPSHHLARPHGPTLPRPRRLQAPPPHDLVRNPATPSSTVPLTFDFIFVGIRFATVRSQKFGSSASAASRSASNRQGPLQRHPRGTCPQDGCAYLTLIPIFWFAL